MKRIVPVLLSLLLVTLTPAAPASIMLHADLTTSQEAPTPPVLTNSVGQPRPESFGFADFLLDDTLPSPFMTMTVTIFNIDVTGSQTADANDNLVNAHIHAPAFPGVNGFVVWGFFGTPFNDTSPNDSLVTPFTTGVGGVFMGKWDAPEGNNTTLPPHIPDILAGLSYINFHTTQNPAGEIRGQILPVSVPEPPVLALTAVALLLLGSVRAGSSRVR